MKRLRAGASATGAALDLLLEAALLRSLEPAITAISRLLDRARPEATDDGEPNGFDGIDRTGSIDHLLAADWALAGEEPDEFVRRFEHRELSYLHLAHSDERRLQTSLVLFDAGPDQIGRPRIVHLACLVVLARRATAAGAELHWGTLQSDDRNDVTHPDTLVRLVNSRTLEPTPKDPPIDGLFDDTLVVSGSRKGWPARELVLVDTTEGIVASIVDNRTGVTRTALIPLPPPDHAIRILRDPSGTATGAMVRSKAMSVPTSNLVFDHQGNKLLARTGDGRSLVVIPAPHAPIRQPGRLRYVQTDERLPPISAAGRVKRSVLTLTVIEGGHEVVVRSFGGNVTGPEGRFPLHGGPLELSEHDPLGRLTWTDGALCVYLGGHRITCANWTYSLAVEEEAFRWGPPPGHISAVPTEDGWVISDGRDTWSLPRTEDVFGVCLHYEPGQAISEAQALVIDSRRTSVSAVGASNPRRVLYRSDEAIIDAVAHERHPIYAVRTSSGNVVLRSLWPGSTLYQLAAP